jgi:ABC-2 type transport system permease protein
MGNTLAICRKELRVYFTTATSYVLLTAFAALSAYFFIVQLGQFVQQATMFDNPQMAQYKDRMNFNDMVISPVFGTVYVIFLIMLPMITMRLIAEEKRTKTMQLLMTSPVRPLEIVMGKYLAAQVVTVTLLAVTVIFPLILQIFGTSAGDASPVDWSTVFTMYLGLFLLGAAINAIGLFASSVTDSQIVAVIVSFAVLLMFWMISAYGQGKTGFVAELATNLSLITHLEGFHRGLIRVQDFVYYFSLIGLGLFLTHRAVEAERWN